MNLIRLIFYIMFFKEDKNLIFLMLWNKTNSVFCIIENRIKDDY